MPVPHFDNRAKNALVIAQQMAIQMNHRHIGSEHLFYGILSQPQDGLPFQMTFVSNVSNNELLDIIAKQGFDQFQQPQDNAKTNFLPEITAELQECIDNGIKVAEEFAYDYIGLEHLVFGILETPAAHGQKVIGLSQEAVNKLKEVLLNLFVNHGKPASNAEPKIAPKPMKPMTKTVSALSYFTTNLNKKVEGEKHFALLNRDSEIDRLIAILSRKNKNNPVILGEPGVGKTALVEGLADRINKGLVPMWLANKKIYNLDVGGLLAGSVFRGEFEQRLKVIIEEVAAAKDIILFIDELHTTVGAGSSNQNGPDMSNIIKPALSRGEISVIGATTDEEYRTIIKKDKAFERRFQPVRLEEPSHEEVTSIIKGILPLYESYHNANFPEELTLDLVDLADRFLPERRFPDKAIDLLDEAMVRVKLHNAKQNSISKEAETHWIETEKQILAVIKEKNSALINNNTTLAQKLEDDQKALELKISTITTQKTADNIKVTKDILEKTVAEVSGVPLVRISSNIFTKIKFLDETIKTKIFGQPEALEQVTRSLKRSYAGVNPNKGPIASFLLLGPTGVGKTELVKLVTQELYGEESKFLLKIDMSEFRERHSMSRLLGAPAGYVGYEDAPQLTEFLRKHPYSVILFDEIEKGHPENLNILLQMLEEGKVTDAKGQSVSCQHALIFLTSNLGKSQLNKFAGKLGFHDMTSKDDSDYNEIKSQVMAEVEKTIKPEILGRLNAKIVFRPITVSVLKQIINKELGLIQKHLLKNGRSINFKPEITEFVALKANEKIEYGAREVKNLVATWVQDPVAEFLLDNTNAMNMTVKIKDNTVIVENIEPKKSTRTSTRSATKAKPELKLEIDAEMIGKVSAEV
jgi:ATP-dependent Clp protease ATP-binding subunit ClpC